MISKLNRSVTPLLEESAMASFSPDLPTRVAYWHDDQFWVMDANAGNKQRVMTLDLRFNYPVLKWFPDGKLLAFLRQELGFERKGFIEVLRLGEQTSSTLYEGPGLAGMDFSLTRDGRLIFTQALASEEPTYELLQLPIDLETARPIGATQRLTRWVGPAPGFVSVSSDGKRIVTTKGYSQSDVFIADLEAGAQRLSTERRLTLDTKSDWTAGWTKDGMVLFFSNRNGVFNLFKQHPSASIPDPIVRGKEDHRMPQTSPDGEWLLYMVWPQPGDSGPVRIMRTPQSSGPAEEVLSAKGDAARSFSGAGEQDTQAGGPRMFPDFRCPLESAPCVLGEAEQDAVVFTRFDPIKGRLAEVHRVTASPSKFFWDLSPDGARVAYGEFSSKNDTVTVVSLSDRTTYDVKVTGRTRLSSVSWSADGRSLFVTTYRIDGSDLLHVTRGGEVVPLRQERNRWISNPKPSPDGRRLAYAVRTTDSNVWLIETK